ncbi:MAG: histidine--tRNA ligase [Bifidobacteriaceae bacterium]|jgi:histidyl-tRNA synthetase|nr:histidine--tRNA ligase [Bifidobacteriaceae bacterium]
MKISGFRELTPNQRFAEKQFLQIIENTFSLYGFESIETSSAQSASDLLAKGETSKEIYLLSRLQGVENNKADINLESEKQLGLRFDQTIPLANYIYQFSNDIIFPFRAYQIGKVWRGERAQAGRFREFTQADIDIISSSTLTITDEIECILTVAKAFKKLENLGCPPITININNRKIIESYYKYIGIENVNSVLQIVDKLPKIGEDGVIDQLQKVNAEGEKPLDKNAAKKIVDFTHFDLQTLESDKEFFTFLSSSSEYSSTIEEFKNMKNLISQINKLRFENVKLDFSIARGLDYYTGLVFETFLEGFESLGSVCSGGRYDNLVKKGNTVYQGIGASIGLTRLLYILFENSSLKTQGKTAADTFIILDSENDRQAALCIAEVLRNRGISTIISPKANKYGKQIEMAQKLGIKYVWFLSPELEIKNIITGEQKKADPKTWMP